MTVDKFTAREIVRHVLIYLEQKFPHLNLHQLHTDSTKDENADAGKFWTELYADVVKRVPYVDGTEHKFDRAETQFDKPKADDK